MTYSELIDQFLKNVQAIKKENPAYKQPGDGSGGVCDCIGLVIGAIRRMGLKWTGIHGSNYAARFQTVGLAYIAKQSDLALGDVVYKACDSSGTVRKACDAGTMKHKYDLPSRYTSKGSKYYDGDLLDYYHAGVVTSVSPLNITHMTSPHMMVDTNLKGGWNYHGKVKLIVNAASGGVTPTPTPTPTPEPDVAPSEGSTAIVYAENGKPVKMRQYPSTSCRTYDELPVGTKVTIVEPGETWAKINGGKRKGWYMMAKFLDVVGDNKGKY